MSECNAINCLSAKTNNIQNYLNKGNIKVKKLIPCGRHATIGDEHHKFSEVWTEDLYVDDSSIHFSNGVDLKTNNDGLLVTTTSTGVENTIGTLVQTLSGNNETSTITKPGLVLLEATNSVYNVSNTGNVGDTLKIIRTKNNEGWEAVSSTGPNGTVYTMFRDELSNYLYIGGQWYDIIGGVENTQNLAKLPFGSTGPWEAVGSTGPVGSVLTMFRDYGPTGSLYIGGKWPNINDVENTANLAKLPYGSTQWEAVGATGPIGIVRTMFRDGPTGYLYIGGTWDNELGNVLNTKKIAKLPYGSTGPWEAVVETGGFIFGGINTMFRDYGPTGSLYIGGFWKTDIGEPNTANLAKLPFGSTGPWEPVVETGGCPNGGINTMFRDGPTGSLYIGGFWNNINNEPNTAFLAKLPFGSTGPWEAVSSTGPDGSVNKIFRDGPTGYLYIGGQWSNELGDVPNTQNLAKLPFGSTQWEAVSSTVPNGTVYTMFRDELTGSLYIGGAWNNINNEPNTAFLAKLPFGSTKWEAVGPTGPNKIVKTMFRDDPTGSLYIGGMWTNELGNVPNTKKIARIIEETSIIVNETKYNLPKIGDTLEFVYTDPWVKLK